MPTRSADDWSRLLEETGRATNSRGGARGKATPLVRAIAECYAVNLDTLQGSGLGGRITKGDVLAAAGFENEESEAAYANAWGLAGAAANQPEDPIYAKAWGTNSGPEQGTDAAYLAAWGNDEQEH